MYMCTTTQRRMRENFPYIPHCMVERCIGSLLWRQFPWKLALHGLCQVKEEFQAKKKWVWDRLSKKGTSEDTPSTWVCSQQRSCMRNLQLWTGMSDRSQLSLHLRHTWSSNEDTLNKIKTLSSFKMTISILVSHPISSNYIIIHQIWMKPISQTIYPHWLVSILDHSKLHKFPYSHSHS